MPVTVKLPTQLRANAGGEATIAVDGGTVGAALEDLYGQHPGLKTSLCNDDGTLRRFVNVYVNGEDIRFGDGLDTAIADGAELQVLPAVAGG